MNIELYGSILEAEKRLKKARLMMKNSRYLSGLERTNQSYLYFNEFRLCVEVVVKDSYQKLIDSLKELRSEKIPLELSTAWESGEEAYFRYGDHKGAIQLLFSCNKDSIPEQLQRYIKK